MTHNKPSDSNNRAATEHFFAELEHQIVQRLRTEANSDEGRETMLRETGIDDMKLLDELRRLGITADGIVALRLFPLALVAWAEDTADRSERAAVMTEGFRLGIQEGSSAWVVLDQWLNKRPPGLGVDAWKRYLHNIFSGMSTAAQQRLIDLTKKQMTEIAKASGGHLGFGKVSKKEQAVINQVTNAMRQQLQMR